MSGRDLRGLSGSVLEKQQDLAKNACVVPCFDYDALVPIMAQKQKGRNHTMWAEFMEISANEAHWWLMTWAVPKSWSPELSKTELLAYQGNGDLGCSKEKRSAIFLEHMKLRTAVISKCSRKSQTYTCPHKITSPLVLLCCLVIFFIHLGRQPFLFALFQWLLRPWPTEACVL